MRQKQRKAIPLEKLTFTSDYIFMRVMENKSLVKRIMETLFSKELKDELDSQTQQTLSFSAVGKRAVFDCFLEDKETVIDLEMQTHPEKGWEKRIRRYQSLLDQMLCSKDKTIWR